MRVDYLVIGQGICGTFLSWNLLSLGKTVMVIDDARPFSSSRVAGGVINPVTGRRIVKTWMIDELLPFALKEYGRLGALLGEELARECSILQFHPTRQMQEAFEGRYQADPEYLELPAEDEWKPFFNFDFGLGAVRPAVQVNLVALLNKWAGYLQQEGMLRNELFQPQDLSFDAGQVSYGGIRAEKLIFCNGVDAYKTDFFNRLPFATNKGEAVIARIPGLPSHHVYKHSLSIVPWNNDLFWVGSTYEWDYPDLAPRPAFRQHVEMLLGSWLKLPYEIVDHMAAERPATLERRPFVGLHPAHPAIGIFNGMGTKGCSLAPYFGRQLARHLVWGEPIHPAADVERFKGVLKRDLS